MSTVAVAWLLTVPMVVALASYADADECEAPLTVSTTACSPTWSQSLMRVLHGAPRGVMGCQHPDSVFRRCIASVDDAKVILQVAPAGDLQRPPSQDAWQSDALDIAMDLAKREGLTLASWRFGPMLCLERIPPKGRPVRWPPISCLIQRQAVAVSVFAYPGARHPITVHDARLLLEVGCVDVFGCEAQ